MKRLRVFLAIASIVTAVAAEKEKLPDWMSTKIQIRWSKPQTVADHLALAKAAVEQKTKLSPKLEIPAEVLATRSTVSPSEVREEMSFRVYLDLVLQNAQVRRHVWKKSGEDGLKFVQMYLRGFEIHQEQRRKLEKEGPLSAEHLAKLLKTQGSPVSTDCKIIWKEDGRIFVDGLPSDIDEMEKLLKRVGWSG